MQVAQRDLITEKWRRDVGEYLTAIQLANRLQVSADTVRDMAKSGRIPEIRVSAKVRRFDPAAVDQALKKNDRREGGAS